MPANTVAHRLMSLPPTDLARTVLTSASGRLTHGELRDSMLRHAAWLAGSEGVAPGERVAVALPKTIATVELIYGILAAGAAFVPLQFQGPPARLAGILASLNPALFIATRETIAELRKLEGTAGRRMIAADEAGSPLADGCLGVPARQHLAEVSETGLAAIFFTSGSTGEPKGVMWSQRGMAAAIAALPRWRGQNAGDRMLGVAPLHYSAGAEIFYPLFNAASMHLCTDREILFPAYLAEVMEKQRITIWSASATALRLLVEGGELGQRDLSSLRRVEMYGEPMSPIALHAAMTALPHVSFNNLYAASEAFDMIEYEVPRPLPDETALPLGRPSPIYQLSLRDDDGNEVAAGETGEICVVGPAVTVGYWNDPALSEHRRLPGLADSYRTGDLARLDNDGLIRLVGRRDHQIKLRGHRFDLGEIEAAARGDPRVRDAVAFLPAGGGDRGSVALAVLTDSAEDEAAKLHAALKRLFTRRLPAFARPAKVILTAEFPRLSSGKIDRRAIARMELKTSEAAE